METARHGSVGALYLESHKDLGEFVTLTTIKTFNTLRRRHALLARFQPCTPLRSMQTAEGHVRFDRPLPMEEIPRGERDEEPFKTYRGQRNSVANGSEQYHSFSSTMYTASMTNTKLYTPLYLAQHSVPCLIEYIHQDIGTIIRDGAVIVRIQISRKLPSVATSLARSISHGNECGDTGTPRGRCGSLCVCDLSVRGT